MLSYDKQLKALSQHLRENMTDAENMVWLKLRRKQLKGYQFYRQKIIGNYIVDFYCPNANLVIELDGGQHYSEMGQAKDRARDDVLKKMGLKVLRFSDRDVFENMGGLMEEVWGYLWFIKSPLAPLFQRGGKKKQKLPTRSREDPRRKIIVSSLRIGISMKRRGNIW
jgi:very-short-patch-repair endonuclease